MKYDIGLLTKMTLQKRLYGFYSVFFNKLVVSYSCKLSAFSHVVYTPIKTIQKT